MVGVADVDRLLRQSARPCHGELGAEGTLPKRLPATLTLTARQPGRHETVDRGQSLGSRICCRPGTTRTTHLAEAERTAYTLRVRLVRS